MNIHPARGLARDLCRDLDKAHYLARRLCFDLASGEYLGCPDDDPERARAFDAALRHALILADGLTSDLKDAGRRAFDLNLDLASGRDPAGALDRVHALDLAGTLDRVHALDLDLDRVRATCRDRIRGFGRGDRIKATNFRRIRDDPERAHKLAHALDRVQARGLDLDLVLDDTGPVVSRDHEAIHPAVRVTAPARRLATVASGLLPAADRGRYHEEYQGELWQLADAGGGRRQQIQCAARQVRGAMPLRFALLSPRRWKASP